MFPYFIKLQQQMLSDYVADVGMRKVAIKAPTVSGCRQALEETNHSYAAYTIRTKSFVGKLKSLIPFTTEFSLRIRCARQIDHAYSLLKQVDKNVKQLEKAKKQPPVIAAVTPKRSRSDGDISGLPTVYASPIKRSKSTDNTPSNSTSVKPIITTRPKFLH